MSAKLLQRSATDWKNKANESQVRGKVLNVYSFFVLIYLLIVLRALWGLYLSG